jgi:putative FmdB family regulatory protein
MASYDLVCETCGSAFEVFRQGFLADDDRVCPSCGSRDVRQKFSSFLTSISGGDGGGCSTAGGSPFG